MLLNQRRSTRGAAGPTVLISLALLLGLFAASFVPGKVRPARPVQEETKPSKTGAEQDKTQQPDSKTAGADEADSEKPDTADDKADTASAVPSYETLVEWYKPIHEAKSKIDSDLVPTQEEGEKLIAGQTDQWGNQIKYLLGDGSYQLISAGPDGDFFDKEKAGPDQKNDDLALGPFKKPNWQDSVDAWFGSYLVTPMSTFLFFDFFTGPEPTVDGNFDGTPDHPLTNAVVKIRRGMGVNPKGWLVSLGLAPASKPASIPFVVVWLLFGALFFTIRMFFINIRGFWHAIRLTRGDYDDPNNEGDVSHFQALSAALSATVGLGNIAGVALAISAGGPGATFWMIVIGLVGMTSKFTECTLGQMYRKVDAKGQITGGPMHYLKDGLAEMGYKKLGVFLAFFFSILCIGGSIGGGNTFQVVQSLGAIQQDPNFEFLKDYPWIYGLVMVLLVGAVFIGGIKVIGKVAGRVVPVMCGIYVLFAVIILFMNAGEIPTAFSKIFAEAFKPQAIYGGFLGVLVIGITRAVFSNEAGTGSAAIAHSAAKTDIPVREGIVALLEPFIDTVVVCTMTALVIIITNSYSNEATEAMRAKGEGAALTAYAFREGGFEFFKYVLYAAVFLFAFSTCISWSYYGERCWTHWFGEGSSMIYKILFLVFTFLGSIVSATNIKNFSDILILSMALPNILGVLLLSGKVKRALDDYWGKLKSGEVKPYK